MLPCWCFRRLNNLPLAPFVMSNDYITWLKRQLIGDIPCPLCGCADAPLVIGDGHGGKFYRCPSCLQNGQYNQDSREKYRQRLQKAQEDLNCQRTIAAHSTAGATQSSAPCAHLPHSEDITMTPTSRPQPLRPMAVSQRIQPSTHPTTVRVRSFL